MNAKKSESLMDLYRFETMADSLYITNIMLDIVQRLRHIYYRLHDVSRVYSIPALSL
jgi:hypothetical protein